MYATLASRDVDCCLIPESPFYLEGSGGLFEFIDKRLKENGHMVIVIAEGAGQELLSESLQSMDQKDASGNKLLQDVGLWISQRIKVALAIYCKFFFLLLLFFLSAMWKALCLLDLDYMQHISFRILLVLILTFHFSNT